MIGTSERTVRNYITQINEEGTYSIESSRNGYRMKRERRNTPGAGPGKEAAGPVAATDVGKPAPASGPQSASVADTVDERALHVLSRLVSSKDAISIFDLADELCISDSTLTSSVLPYIRQLLAQFDLGIQTHDFNVSLVGSEQDKRHLLGHLATQDTNGYFTSTNTLKQLFPSFDVENILGQLLKICQRSELILNNYALNNLLMHVLVIVIRLRQGNALNGNTTHESAETLVDGFAQRDAILCCADDIEDYVRDEFGCTITDEDYQQIVMLIALSVERYSYDELTTDKLVELVGQDFFDMCVEAANSMSARFGVSALDESSLLQLTLHMYNAQQRAVYHVGYSNPLTSQIKNEHAALYDMAVYFTHRFSSVCGTQFNEDEIAFVAFHVGAYLEQNSSSEDDVTCIIIVEEYHDFSLQLIMDLKKALDYEVTILGALSYEDYIASHPKADIIITTVDIPVTSGEKILVGPFLTKQNLRKIQNKIQDVLERKRMEKAYGFLSQMLDPDLYVRNLDLGDNSNAYIDYLGALAMSRGYVDRAFVDDVRLREEISSTAFTEYLAIPHSINSYAARSFIAVLHNDKPIPWGRHNVNFVLLIGIAEDEMGCFRDVLDIIIELFSSLDRTARLLQTKTFDEFFETFTEVIS